MEALFARWEGKNGSAGPSPEAAYPRGSQSSRLTATGSEVPAERRTTGVLEKHPLLSVDDGELTSRLPSKSSHMHPKCLLSALHLILFLESLRLGLQPVVCQSRNFNEVVELKSLCGGGPLAKNRIISAGMVLWSKTHPKMNCKVTFRTETTLQHFMIRFDRLKLDCRDRLLVFDTDHADSDPKLDLDCNDVPSTVGMVQVPTNFLTVVFKTDRYGLEDHGFRMVVTAFKKTGISGCREFECPRSFACISSTLVCDGVRHCDDGADETVGAGCAVFSGDLAQLIGRNGLIVFAVVAGCVVAVLLVAVMHLYCRKPTRAHNAYQPARAMQQNQFHVGGGGCNQHPMAAGVAFTRNGGKQLYDEDDASYVHGMTAMPKSGNVMLPAGGMGYEGHTTLLPGN